MANDNDNIAKVTYEKTTEKKINVTPPEQLREPVTEPQNVGPTSTTLDRVGATGYEPNLQQNNVNRPKSDIVRKPSLDNTNNSNNNLQNGPTASKAPINKNEEAPDLGKNYGPNMGDPGYNGYQSDKGKPNGAQPSSDNKSKDNTSKGTSLNGGVPVSQEPQRNSHQGLHKDGEGLEKENDLNNGQEIDDENSLPQKKDEPQQKESESTKEKGKDNPEAANQGEATDSNPKKTSNGKKEETVNPEAPNPKKNVQNDASGNNGLSPLKKQLSEDAYNSDPTARALRNFEHNKRVQQGSQQASGTNNSGTNGSGTKSLNPFKKNSNNSGTNDKTDNKGSLGSKIKNGLSKLGKNRSKDSIEEGGKGGKSRSKAFLDNLKKVAAFMAAHPHLSIIIGVVILILIILIACCIDDYSGKSSSGKGAHCTYNLKGVSTTGEVKLEGLQVELINCDGTASNYTVLETVDFEKYVLGVALAEIGPGSPAEAIKAQLIAARGFALSRNRGMCPGNQDGCFYGYNASTGKIRMRACEADQVYWDYEKDIYRQDRGSISVYSPEINSGTLWKSALSEESISYFTELANDVKGKVLIDSSGNVVSTNYVASTSQQFISKANEGKTYEEILSEVYADSDGFSTGECTSYGNIDYGDYVLSSDGHTILHEPIDQFLKSNGSSLEEFNSLIASNVEKAGFGTRAGVVAAAVTLIGELGNNYGVRLPYFWGGGHADGVVIGALDTWGSRQCHTYANNTSYDYCGLDCSGFVPWAIKNGGFNMSQNLAGNFKNLPGVRQVSLSNSAVLQPGDLLESTQHVVLVIGIEESTSSYICAEASGNSEGVKFSRRPFNSSGYWGVDMEGYYANNVRSN